MIFSQSFLRTIVLFIGLYSLAACDGDADKFREAVIAGDIEIESLAVTAENEFILLDKGSIDPNNTVIDTGGTLQFTAKVKHKNQASSDFTGKVRWTTLDPSIAAIDSNGLLTGKQEGETTVIARFAEFESKVQLTVLTATLFEIVIRGPVETDKCRNVSFKATGQYQATIGRLSRNNLDVDWSLSNQDVATISNDGDAEGILTSMQMAGTVDVIATKGNIKQSQTVTIKDSSPTTISVTPATVSIAINETLQLVAKATYPDKSEGDIPSIVAWISDDAGIASMDAKGLLKGVAKGGTAIRGSCGGVESNSVTVTVTGRANGDAIRINDGKDFTLKSDDKDDKDLQLTLTLIKADGSGEDVTEEADWSIEEDIISAIEVSNAKGSKGKITINGLGTTQVKANYKEQTARIDVTIEP
jgi:hypothetical protein